MIKYNYSVLIKQISEGLIIPNDLWIKDNNDVEWFWYNGNFATGMKNGDKEPPLIYITDKYNIVDLYNLELEVLNKSKFNKLYSMQELLDKYSDSKDVVYVKDDKTNCSWEFIPLNKSIISADTGESIFDFLNADEVSMAKFEILWKEECLPKEEIKSITLDNALEQIKELKEALDKLETTILSLNNIKEA